MCAKRSLCVPRGAYVCQEVPMCAKRSLCVLRDPYVG